MISGVTTAEAVHTDLTNWLSGARSLVITLHRMFITNQKLGPKTPGLVILEHEIDDRQVDAFMASFPLIAQNGWKFESLAQIYPDRGGPYQNAASSTSTDVVRQSITEGSADGGDDDTSSSTSSSPSSTQSNTGSTSTQTTSAGSSSATTSAGASAGNSGMIVQPAFAWSFALGFVGLASGLFL